MQVQLVTEAGWLGQYEAYETSPIALSLAMLRALCKITMRLTLMHASWHNTLYSSKNWKLQSISSNFFHRTVKSDVQPICRSLLHVFDVAGCCDVAHVHLCTYTRMHVFYRMRGYICASVPSLPAFVSVCNRNLFIWLLPGGSRIGTCSSGPSLVTLE